MLEFMATIMGMENSSATISVNRVLEGCSASTLQTELMAGPLQAEEAQDRPVRPRGTGDKQFSIRVGRVSQRMQPCFEAMVCQGLPPGLVQVPLSTPLTPRLSGPQVTVDSRAVPVPAILPAEEVPEAAQVEGSMGEGVTRGPCNASVDVACF